MRKYNIKIGNQIIKLIGIKQIKNYDTGNFWTSKLRKGISRKKKMYYGYMLLVCVKGEGKELLFFLPAGQTLIGFNNNIKNLPFFFLCLKIIFFFWKEATWQSEVLFNIFSSYFLMSLIIMFFLLYLF